MPSFRSIAALIGLALLAAACAQPAEPTSAPPEPTMAQPTEMAPTEAPAEPVGDPTVPSEEVEPMPDDGAPDEPVVEGGAEPAVQLIAMTDPSAIQVGQEAMLAVLTADSDGIDRVELQIDGTTVSSLTANSAEEFQGVLTWTPDAAGERNAVVIVFDTLGLPGQAEQRSITVLPAAPTAVPPTGAPAPATAVPPTPVPAAAPPAVSITPLTPRVEPGQDIQIATNAVSEAGIVRLELFMNDRLVDTWVHDPASGDPRRSEYRTLHFRRAREGQFDAWVRAYAADGQVGQSVRERVRVRPAATPGADEAPGDEEPTAEATPAP